MKPVKITALKELIAKHLGEPYSKIASVPRGLAMLVVEDFVGNIQLTPEEAAIVKDQLVSLDQKGTPDEAGGLQKGRGPAQ